MITLMCYVALPDQLFSYLYVEPKMANTKSYSPALNRKVISILSINLGLYINIVFNQCSDSVEVIVIPFSS